MVKIINSSEDPAAFSISKEGGHNLFQNICELLHFDILVLLLPVDYAELQYLFHLEDL
jgi:hypothetical protein